MTFQESIRVCFAKYADFNGTASRSEYWWFVLFVTLAGSVASVIGSDWASIFCLAIVLPMLAAGTRRLRDSGRSGWLQLLVFVPVAGIVVVTILLAQQSVTQPAAPAAPLAVGEA